MILVEKLWKRYGLPIRPTIRQFTHRLRGQSYDETRFGTWSLKDVSFEVQRGETLGVIGHNGAGKSTLLKVLAGVSLPTRGGVKVEGRIFPMIELNAGIHGELTGRENVFLLGSVMGFPRHLIREKLAQIEAFCELEEWFDKPAWQYSSGMLARLGFGVAMNVEADILLIDEVLAVGDLAFQQKCYRRLAELRQNGTTTLLVSHNIRQIERLCDRAIWMDHGQLLGEGNPSELAEAYYQRAHATAAKLKPSSHTSDTILLHRFEIQNSRGEKLDRISAGEGIQICMDLEALQTLYQVQIGIAFVSPDLLVLSGITNDHLLKIPVLEGKARLRCLIPTLPLNPTQLSLRLKISEATGATLLSNESITTLEITRSPEEQGLLADSVGLVRLKPTWMIEYDN